MSDQGWLERVPRNETARATAPGTSSTTHRPRNGAWHPFDTPASAPSRTVELPLRVH